MARIHVMTGDGADNYTCICHAPTPAGNNSAGVAWNTAVKNALNPVTAMSIGNGGGQITTNEANQVASGDVIEVSFQFTDNPAWDANTRTTQLNLVAADAVTRTQSAYAAKLKWFGATVA